MSQILVAQNNIHVKEAGAPPDICKSDAEAKEGRRALEQVSKEWAGRGRQVCGETSRVNKLLLNKREVA